MGVVDVTRQQISSSPIGGCMGSACCIVLALAHNVRVHIAPAFWGVPSPRTRAWNGRETSTLVLWLANYRVLSGFSGVKKGTCCPVIWLPPSFCGCTTRIISHYI